MWAYALILLIDFDKSLFVLIDGTPPSNYGLVVPPSLSVPIGFGGAFFNGSKTLLDFVYNFCRHF